MKKIFFLLAALCFTVSACMSPATPQAGTNSYIRSRHTSDCGVPGGTNTSIPANPYSGSKQYACSGDFYKHPNRGSAYAHSDGNPKPNIIDVDSNARHWYGRRDGRLNLTPSLTPNPAP